jgi:Tol biopolymer transport system component
MNAKGGQPRLLVDAEYSYFHGWSPDGAMLCYTGRREGIFEICSIPFDGGDETCLTSGFQHCDGPDYSADGRWIWFNGERDGTVDLWRIAATGGTPERMTRDDRINWFPHPSPRGGAVVYLSYAPGTKGHPAGCHVELRAMPADGGPTRRLAKLFGGQGTINVPSWSPGGDAFAYVRYLSDRSGT